MHRTEDTYAVAGRFTDGPPGTRVGSDWLNAIQEEICYVITQAGYNLNNRQTDDYTQLYTALRSMLGLTMTAREKWTRSHGGQWCEFAYYDSDEIMVKCKNTQGLGSFAGFVLNDDTYLEIQSDQKVKLDVPGSSGQIIDGITARLNSEWYILWAYKTSAGSLGFAFTWMANTTFSNANPTNALTLNQVNGQDIGYLFSVDSGVVVWQDSDEWETPLAWQNAGAVTLDTSKNKPKVLSRTTTVLTLGANLENNDFLADSRVYQVSGFKPLQISDGNIASVIGTRGYRDTGFRVFTTAAGAITDFVTSGNIVSWLRPVSADFNPTVTSTVYYNNWVPPDVREAIVSIDGFNVGGVPDIRVAMYWDTSGNCVQQATVYVSGNITGPMPLFHRLTRVWILNSTNGYFYTYGWIMPT